MEGKDYIYGVGLVVVKGAMADHMLHDLVGVVMSDATQTELDKARKGQFKDVAERLQAKAPDYLCDHPDLLKRLNHVLPQGIQQMQMRGDLAHSTWILDPSGPPGFDLRLHIRSGKEWWVGDKAFESVANKLGVVAVNMMKLMSDILERTEKKHTQPLPKNARVTYLDWGPPTDHPG